MKTAAGISAKYSKIFSICAIAGHTRKLKMKLHKH
jgi:hypothetical protein